MEMVGRRDIRELNGIGEGITPVRRPVCHSQLPGNPASNVAFHIYHELKGNPLPVGIDPTVVARHPATTD